MRGTNTAPFKAARAVLALALAATLAGAAMAQQAPRRLLRQPTISQTDIVFVYGGDLWTVPRAGGLARRLTANPSIKRYPHFSPDGTQVAFTGNYDGNTDIYSIPALGGEPKRLTYHPYTEDALGWTPDSKRVLFRSFATAFSPGVYRLYTVGTNADLPRELPMPEGTLGSFSPDGTKIAYNRIERELAGWKWKRYRGGAQAYVSIFDLKTNAYSEVDNKLATDYYPMWYGDHIYFISDRDYKNNLFVYSTKDKSIKQLTQFKDYDIKWPTLGADAIVWERGGEIEYYDLKANKVVKVDVDVRSEMLSARPYMRNVTADINTAAISPSGARAVVESYGEVFTVPAQKGDSRNITNSAGVREINPVWSPDGRHIAYLSDQSGEWEIYLKNQDGTGEPTRITTDGAVYRNGPSWSPDGKWLHYSDLRRRLWIVNIDDKKPILMDDAIEYQGVTMGNWSPDSNYIVYTKALPNFQGAIFLYSVKDGKTKQISRGRFNDGEPVFDLTGKYIYFTSDRNFNPVLGGPELDIGFGSQTAIFMMILGKDTPVPLRPESDEEPVRTTPPPGASGAGGAGGPGAGGPGGGRPGGGGEGGGQAAPPAPAFSFADLEIDTLEKRILPLPMPFGAYNGLTGGANRVFYMNGPALMMFDLNARQNLPIIQGIAGYTMNQSASKMLYFAPGPGGLLMGIVDVAPGRQVGQGAMAPDLRMQADPRAEWREIFIDAWRYQRDNFYDPNMRGMDWGDLRNRYGKLLPEVAHRDDLTYLLTEMMSELSTSHLFVSGPPQAGPSAVNVGLLGVDWMQVGNHWGIKKIIRGENWDPTRRSPLTEPGVNINVGDVILSVNGIPMTSDTNPYQPFLGLGNRTVTLEVQTGNDASTKRTVQVRTIASEIGLRYFDWIETNREKVEAATGGRVGYVHVPDTQLAGMREFGRGFYSQTDKDALIVDERYNGGGFIPDFFIEKLKRNRPLTAITARWGPDVFLPQSAVYGPKVMLVNEWAGSGGDAFPDFFQQEKLGPVIGERTAGGLVGISGQYTLMDDGSVSSPSFGLWAPDRGEWIAENRGVIPDIPVKNRPDLMVQGRDPQLEKAIEVILEQLRKNPPKKPKHPPFPVDERGRRIGG